MPLVGMKQMLKIARAKGVCGGGIQSGRLSYDEGDRERS